MTGGVAGIADWDLRLRLQRQHRLVWDRMMRETALMGEEQGMRKEKFQFEN